MKNLVETFYNKRTLMTALLVLVNIIAIVGLFQIRLQTDMVMFSPEGSEYIALMDEAEAAFGSNDQLVVLLPVSDLETDTISSTLSFIEDVKEIEGVEAVQSLQSGIPVNGSLAPYSESLHEAYISYYEGLEEFSPMITSDGESFISMVILIEASFDNTSLDILKDMLDVDYPDALIAGDLYNQTQIFDYIVLILATLVPITLFTILLVFFTQLRSIKATIFSVLPAGIGSLWTMGFLGWKGDEVSLISAVIPIFIIVIGSADGLHFITHMQEELEQGSDKIEALTHTLKMVGVPMLITTLTSAGGFLALFTIPITAIHDLAFGSALGILFAGVATWWVLPIIMFRVKDLGKAHASVKQTPKPLKLLRGIPVVVLSLAVLLAGYTYFPEIKSEFNSLMMYKESSDVYMSAHKIQEVMDGSIPIIYLSEEQDLSSYDTYLHYQNLTDELLASDAVLKVVSPYRIISLQATQLGVPINEMSYTMIWTMISANEQIQTFINQDTNQVRMFIYPRDLDNATLDEIDSLVDPGLLTGIQHVMKEVNESVVTSQIISILVAIGIIFLFMILSLRKISLALISLLPIILSIVGLYAFLGFSGISLNIMTVIIFSITIGVGIDYAIHYISVYKTFRSDGFSNEESLNKTDYYTSRAILTNASGIAIGLTTLQFSPLTIHSNVSTLMWVSMVLSVLFTMTLVPTVLKYVHK